MTQQAATSQSPKKRRSSSADQLSAKRVADAAEEMARRHLARLKHLSELAKSVLRYAPRQNTQKAKDCAKLARDLADFANQCKRRAHVDDIISTLVATGKLHLLDEDVRNTVLSWRDKPDM